MGRAVFVRYLVRRLARVVLVVWAAYTLSFAVLYLLPSDPVETMLAGESGADAAAVDPAQLAALRHRLGFDRSAAEQYVSSLGRALHGDLGLSVRSGASVGRTLLEALPPTLAVAALALPLAAAVAIVLAVAGSWPRSAPLRRLAGSLPALGAGLPSFWIGLLLMQWISFRWGLLPATGGQGLEGALQPAVTLALPVGCVLAQVLGRGMRHALAQPYADAARARGVGRARLHLAHALRNAAVPVVALLGVITGQLLSGAVLVETVFARDGLGRVAVEAVTDQDLPLVQGVVVLTAAATAAASLLVDLVIPLLDPRAATVGTGEGR
ncbi:ABC transporter permease [Streptomyces sp. VRA16 Mangrove soil]|uniref:ABC transporter permease n=1 Tax=Streptomyces sp. VRA16 Mangrove soil TaxID=2817434 RepID=UPI001A9D7E4F|nr:ABC transporter permease [Streptomyces sp. VRA16 Mangrove soil]MBO1332648.1 ABC transporter permease [Streptomyces sp. VRA16 Mangrove soil]